MKMIFWTSYNYIREKPKQVGVLWNLVKPVNMTYGKCYIFCYYNMVLCKRLIVVWNFFNLWLFIIY